MRSGPNARRPMRRGGGNNNNNNNNNSGNNSGRRGGSPRTQNFESNGPDIKVRGNAQQIVDKYQTLAREAATAGNPVMAENYYQHAEHYHRVLSASGGGENRQNNRQPDGDNNSQNQAAQNNQQNANGQANEQSPEQSAGQSSGQSDASTNADATGQRDSAETPAAQVTSPDAGASSEASPTKEMPAEVVAIQEVKVAPEVVATQETEKSSGTEAPPQPQASDNGSTAGSEPVKGRKPTRRRSPRAAKPTTEEIEAPAATTANEAKPSAPLPQAVADSPEKVVKAVS